MKLKLILFFLGILLCFSQDSSASHGMGGEITWRCLPNGQFVFQLKFYRDCNGIPLPTGPLNLNVCNHPTVNNIVLNQVQLNDISPAGCSTCAGGGPGTVQEGIFESNPITLNGTPPAQGWVFDWSSCCRSPSITNLINPGSQSFQLRAVMYAYNGQNTNPCYDSSPRFSEKPSTILCGGFPFEYNNIAFDPELDSLVYSWAPALDASACNAVPLGYTPGYSPASPLPGPAQNPLNVAAVLDPQTGIVSYTSYTSGYFATVVQVNAFKCGQLVASIFREINVVLLGGAGCQLQGSGLTNLPPVVTAPFPDTSGQFTLYNDTVCAGDTVTFFMSATDPDWDPAVGGLQTVTMIGAGPQFIDFVNFPGTGCLNPPCAFTFPPLPVSAPFGTGVNFEWVTSCEHLDFSQGCFTTGSTYTFLIRAQDNFCDAPAVNFNTISITVLAPEPLDSTTIRCVDVLPNGDVTLNWTNPKDPYGSWLNYQIETSPTAVGPWSTLDSVLVQNQTTFTHIGANAQNNEIFYRMFVRSGCDSSLVSEYSNIASSMLLDVVNPGNFTANISWNPVHNPLISGSSSWYHIYQELPANSGNWLFVDSTQNTSFIDTLNNVCSDTVNYRIELMDSTGCISRSSIDGELWQNILTPDPPSIRCISVSPFGSLTINWQPPVDTADSFDGYFIYESSNAGGPWALVDSFFNYNQLGYSDLLANVYSGTTHYYQIQTKTSCLNQFSGPSNTVTPIILNVSNANLAVPNLTWNAIQNPLLPSSNSYYYIYTDYPGGVWQFLDSTQSTSYFDTSLNDICIDSINYRIEITDASGCTSVSSIDGATFQVINTPDPPDLRCVVVEPTGEVSINWIVPSDTASSFDGYFVYVDPNGGGVFTLLDSVFTYGINSYTHVGSNVYGAGPYSYKVTTRTACASTMSIDSRIVTPIILNVTNVGGNANLSWNPVSAPAPPGAGQYQVYEEFPAGSGSWNLLGSTSNTTYNTPVTTVNCNDSVNYRIEQANTAPCNSVSSLDGATFYDAVIPDAPDFRCVAVQPNGNVTLSWIAPLNLGTRFDKYRIYSSLNAGGPFILIDSVLNAATLSYTHVGAGAQAQSVYYYLETVSCDDKISLPSVTLQTILLTVVPTPSTYATLNWNSIISPNLPSSSGTYQIYQEYPTGSGVWTLVASTSSLSYIDTLTNVTCVDAISYRVEIADASGCISISSIDGDLFPDPIIPDAPDFRCVSVLPNGDVVLSWLATTKPGTRFDKYRIYSSSNGGATFNLIDSVMNVNTLTYTHIGANAQASSIYYYITSVSCDVNVSAPSVTLQTIYLNVAVGPSSAILTWNPIIVPNLPSSTGTYEIWKEFPTGSGNWSLLTTTSQTNYTDILVITDCFDLISYRVQIADASGCVSISSTDGDQFPDSSVPTAPDLRCVSVNTNGTITVTWLPPTDTVLSFGGYYVYKSNNSAGPFTIIDSVTNYFQLNYTDLTANGNAASVYYRLETKSGCGPIWSNPSVTLQSIFLSVNNVGGNASLTWNPIANPALPSTSPDYQIFRKYPNVAWTLLTTTTSTNYLDIITDVCSDLIEYRIEQADVSGCVSISNVNGDLIKSLLVPDAPSVRCVSILGNGDITLNWIAPLDTALQFNSYHIYYANAPGGPFVQLDSLFNYNTTSFTHVGANGANTNGYYYIQTRSGCGVKYSIPSDTIRAIRLNVANAGNGVANLSWNPIHNPLFSTSDTYYNIYKEYPTGSWNFLDTTSKKFYMDSITVCEEFINYRIEIADASGCISVSSVDGDLFKDVIPPVLTVLDTVSVNPLTGVTTVSWLQNSSGDAVGYNVYLYNGVSWDSIGTTAPANSLAYINLLSNAEFGPELYSIAAFDSCGNLSPIGIGHTTIYLTANLDKCLGAIILNWNDYLNMSSGVGAYNVFVSENGGPYTLLATTAGNETIYAHDNLNRLSTYCYYVQALSNDNTKSASSNKACELADILIDPAFNYITVATVVNSSLIHVEAYVDTAADISYYKLLRSLSITGPYDTVAYNSTLNNPVITFDDITGFPNETSYFYAVAAVNICDKIVSYSAVTRTIHATAVANVNYTNTINWNDYMGFDAGVESYNIYRLVAPGPWSFLSNVPFGVNSYIDDITNIINNDGTFIYRIEGLEDFGNQYGFKEQSFSNETPAIQNPVVFVPNAFTPNGLNPYFKPTIIFVNPNSYTFNIYNRWGDLIYETKDLNGAWAGDINGKPAPQGVYVYMIKVSGANGKEVVKHGSVTLLR